MKRNTSMAVIGLLAFALGAMAVYSFLPADEVQAATVEPAAIPDAYVLALDKETGLPVGALVFSLDGLTCVALPNGAMECACPCDTGLCENERDKPARIPDFPPDQLPIPTDGSIPDDTPTGDIPDDMPTDGDIPDDAPDDTPDNTPETPADDTPPGNSGCNQGRGNGSEGCDPGNSNHNQESNDENERNRGGQNTPRRNGNSNGKGNGK